MWKNTEASVFTQLEACAALSHEILRLIPDPLEWDITSLIRLNTGLFKMIFMVLTTCHTQYTWDRSICIFLFNRTTLKVFVTYLTGALYVHPLWFYKHQHNQRVRSTQNAFSLPFAAILVNCAPSGEMHNYCTPHIIKENWEYLDPSVQLHTAISSVLCMTSC